MVTVTFNSEAVLPDFLDSLWKQTHADFLLFAVDSGSKDSTPARIRTLTDPRVRAVLCEHNIGFAAGCNLGIKMALEQGCDALLLLNNDTVFGSELLRQLLDGLEAHACDMTTPKMLYYEQPNTIWAAGGYLNPWLGYRNQHDGANRFDDGRFNTPHRVTFTPFCCILMRGRVIDTLGYLDEKYFVYTEDADYCFRAMKAGLALWYLPEATLRHKVSALTGGEVSEFTIRYCTRNRIYFLCKALPRPLALGWFAGYWIYQTLRRMLRKDSPEVWRLKVQSMREGLELFAASREKKTSAP